MVMTYNLCYYIMYREVIYIIYIYIYSIYNIVQKNCNHAFRVAGCHQMLMYVIDVFCCCSYIRALQD